jgi:hypothetical protein
MPSNSRPSAANRSANSSHQRTVLTGCEPKGIVFEEIRKTPMSWSTFQRRIASSASRFAAVTSRRRSGVALASRIVLAAEGSWVFTHA